ncbi:kinesin KIN-13B [Olea europaea subsp. europaea]|uniref:Kinesin KIN-13B n=1 Tax=Olea europaea subsp. europaea TaxID=158383 RepID=A0A8S0VHG8_OLEEU|nr:kinesin KIN-13B [Olea europaea subsp. europaea]
MNAVGRQRSGASSTVHHQRQYSDNFLESSSNDQWLQSAGLQHLQSSNNAVPQLQDSRMSRSVQVQRTYSGRSDLFAEPLTPPLNSRSGSQRKNGEEQVSPNDSKVVLVSISRRSRVRIDFLFWFHLAVNKRVAEVVEVVELMGADGFGWRWAAGVG